MRYFKTLFLEEARKFMANTDAKTIKKIIILSKLLKELKTQDFSKKYTKIYGNSELDMENNKLGFWLFGINLKAKKL